MSQRFCWPVEQNRQRPHDGMKEHTTWSPFLTRVTPGPTSSITPAPSWPPMIGYLPGMSPVRMCSSEWHRPAATNRMRTSFSWGGSRSSSTTSQSVCGARRIAALVFMRFSLPVLAMSFEHTPPRSRRQLTVLMTASSLLDPLPLRAGRQAANRIVFAAHVTNLAEDGLPGDRMGAYYERRARGGTGVVVVEEAFVHPSSHPYERAVRGDDPAIVPAYRRLAERLHAAGALALAQLGHAGMQGSGRVRKRALWAPSAVPNPATLEMPKVMEPEDVAAVVDGFAVAARHVAEAGLDGVEVNAGQHSLVRQFLSGLTNERDDAYGGDPERRLRFAREVIAAVRREVKDGVVGLRLCCDELAPWAGIRPEDAPELAVALAEGVDYLSVVAGSIFSVEETRPGLHRPPGHLLGLCGAVRDRLGIPVFASGSLVDPDQAAAAVVTGQADACEMTRALIADPDLPRRLAEHRPDAVRPCIRCNQDCAVRSAANAAVSCVHNPEAGHEADFPAVVPAAAARHVVVVGGGPAGLEAALTAACRGHRVTLLERAEAVGG